MKLFSVFSGCFRLFSVVLLLSVVFGIHKDRGSGGAGDCGNDGGGVGGGGCGGGVVVVVVVVVEVWW